MNKFCTSRDRQDYYSGWIYVILSSQLGIGWLGLGLSLAKFVAVVVILLLLLVVGVVVVVVVVVILCVVEFAAGFA